jgi:hypothetical protein
MGAIARPVSRAGRRGAGPMALAAAGITLLVAGAFFGASAVRLPFAAMTAAAVGAAALYAWLAWQVMAVRGDRVALAGALVAGGIAPLVGAFLLDVLQSLHRGSGDALASSVLLAYWPVGAAALLAGIVAALAIRAVAGRRISRPDQPGIAPDRP